MELRVYGPGCANCERLERHTAIWDMAVLWMMPLAGLLMLLEHPWWPAVGLIAGGAHFDVGGREIAKLLGLRREGFRVGSEKEARNGLVALALISLVGLWLTIHCLVTLAA